MSETESTHSKPTEPLADCQEVKVDSKEELRKLRKREQAKEYYKRKKEARLVEQVKAKVEEKEVKRIPISDDESVPPAPIGEADKPVLTDKEKILALISSIETTCDQQKEIIKVDKERLSKVVKRRSKK